MWESVLLKRGEFREGEVVRTSQQGKERCRIVKVFPSQFIVSYLLTDSGGNPFWEVEQNLERFDAQ